jgi:hypothetical protein
MSIHALDASMIDTNQWILGTLGLVWAAAGALFFVGAGRIQAFSIRLFERHPHIKLTFGTDWPEGRAVVAVLRFFGTLFFAVGAFLGWFAVFPSQR